MWIYGGERETEAGQSRSQGDLEPAGLLEHDQSRGELT